MISSISAAVFFDLGDTLITEVNGQYQLYSDTLDTLNALHDRGYRLGLLSDWPEGTTIGEVYAFLKKYGIAPYIEYELVTISSEIPGNIKKPNKPIFDQALKKSGLLVAGDKSIFVTEDFSHIIAARAYGWRAILKRNLGECKPDEGECVSSLSGLLNLL